MKIYSRVLTGKDLWQALQACESSTVELVPGFDLIEGPRSRRFEKVSLQDESRRRKRNPGTGEFKFPDTRSGAASWDDHGHWMAALFEIDPEAKIVGAATYNGAYDFHSQTEGCYLTKARR